MNNGSHNAKQTFKKVILLGMDGLDPKILTELMQKGHLPNFVSLAQKGGYCSLATSNPAQSPVAWASIATGNNPGYHGIFDFLGRRVADYMPELAITRPNPKNMFGKREAMFLPVMQGNAFWDYSSEKGIPTTIIKWPMTFQPKQNHAMLYAGLGVPDIKGGLGKYSFFTTRNIPSNEEGHDKIIKITLNDNKGRTHIPGPNITKLMSREVAKVDLDIHVSGNSEIEMMIDGRMFPLKEGQWSEWIVVRFNLGFKKTTTGIVKFFLNCIKPELDLYMTSVQINPKDPAFIISSPDEYIKELADKLGHFYTLGMPEDTKAFEEGRINEESFIAMCDEIIDEQEKMLWYEMERFNEGLLAATFFSTDRIQHMFWATRDPQHPLYDRAYADKYGHVIDDYYRKMDRILGDLMKHIENDTALMVFSDHGFTTFRRGVHINSWLVQKGFMTLTKKMSMDDKEGGGLFQHVDWKKTSAYALGFGSIYLNLKGRERQGIVGPGPEAESLSERIISELAQLTDPKDGQAVVKSVYKKNEIYDGGQEKNAPDLVIGFNDGFRGSWQTAIGGSPGEILEDNLKKWSGDHIVDPSIVPGIFLTNFSIKNDTPNLMDIAPTVLSCLGLNSNNMKGHSLI